MLRVGAEIIDFPLQRSKPVAVAEEGIRTRSKRRRRRLNGPSIRFGLVMALNLFPTDAGRVGRTRTVSEGGGTEGPALG